MENNLDKYFQDKLHERKFEMKEEYWLGAQKLLEADERKRKRRVLFWWFSGGLGLLLVGLMGWLLLGENGTDRASTNPTQQVASEGGPVAQNGQAVQPEKGNSAMVVEQPDSVSAARAGASFADGEKNKKKVEVGNASAVFKKSESTDKQRVAKQKSQSQIGAQQSKNSTEDGEKHGEMAIETKSKTISEAASNNDQYTSSTENAKPQKSESALGFERIANLEKLPILFAYVVGNFEEKVLATTTQKIIPQQPRQWHFGLMASQLAFPQVDSGEQRLLGQRMGLVVRCDFRSGLYLSTGMQYHRRVGTFGPSAEAFGRNYRFGLELDTLQLRPNGLHYLGLPIVIGFERNRHQLEAGLLLDYLAGVRGQVGSYRKQGEPPVKVFTATETGWMERTGYRKFVPTAQLAYRYNLVGQWSLGLNLNYQLGGIFDRKFDRPTRNYLLQERGKFHLGLQAVYLFN